MGVNKSIMKTFATLDRIESLILMAFKLTNCVIVVPGSIPGDRMSVPRDGTMRFSEDARSSVYGCIRCMLPSRTMRQIGAIISTRSGNMKIFAISFLLRLIAVRLSVSWMLLNVFIRNGFIRNRKIFSNDHRNSTECIVTLQRMMFVYLFLVGTMLDDRKNKYTK